MATGELLDSVETAFQRIVLAAFVPPLTPPNVYTGRDSQNKKLPCVICAVDGDAEEDPPRTGNYWVNVEISVKHTAATEASDTVDPKADAIALTKSVFDLLRINNLDATINAIAATAPLDLTIFPQGFFFSAQKSGRDELGVYVDTLPVRLYCCPSILAA